MILVSYRLSEKSLESEVAAMFNQDLTTLERLTGEEKLQFLREVGREKLQERRMYVPDLPSVHLLDCRVRLEEPLDERPTKFGFDLREKVRLAVYKAGSLTYLGKLKVYGQEQVD